MHWVSAATVSPSSTIGIQTNLGEESKCDAASINVYPNHAVQCSPATQQFGRIHCLLEHHSTDSSAATHNIAVCPSDSGSQSSRTLRVHHAAGPQACAVVALSWSIITEYDHVLQGVEIEDGGGSGTSGSHMEQRIYYNGY